MISPYNSVIERGILLVCIGGSKWELSDRKDRSENVSRLKHNQDRMMGVSDNSRFEGAVNEICIRIQTRQTVQIYHLFAVMTFYTWYFANKGEFDKFFIIGFVSLVSALVSSVFVMWSNHHDRTIGILSVYCTWYLKRAREGDNKTKKIPGFQDFDQRIMEYALIYRRWSDFSMMLIISPTMAFSIYSINRVFGKPLSTWSILLAFSSLLISIILLIAVFKNSSSRAKIQRTLDFNEETGKWKMG